MKNPNGDFKVAPNRAFQEWVTSTFGVAIPKTAAEIVEYPAGMDDVELEDAFFEWLKQFIS